MSYKLNVKLSKVSDTSTVTIYSDLESNPVSNARTQAVNMEAIKQSLDNLFTTEQYERPFRPDYFNPLTNFIGEIDNQVTLNEMHTAIFDKIQRFEPRVVYNSAKSTITPLPGGHGYQLDLAFNVVGLSNVIYNYSAVLYTTIT